MINTLGNIKSKSDLKKFEEYDIIFIDDDGNVIASKDIKDHAKFNNEFAKDNPGLIDRYKKSNWNNMTLFLICEEGYIQVGKMGIYKGLLYDSSKITKKQQNIINMYNEAEYDIEDLKTDKSEERGENYGR